MKKISLGETEAFDAGGFKGNLFIDKRHGLPFNALLIDCVERHFKMRLVDARRTYFVVDGLGAFVVNGKREEVKPFDLVMIEDGDTFEYEGLMRLFEFNIPATDERNEQKME